VLSGKCVRFVWVRNLGRVNMDFMTAVKTVLQQKYADFNGRAPRSEY